MKIIEKDNIIELLKDFPVIKTACKKGGISRATFYRWIEDDSDFKIESKKAMKEGILSINDTAEENLITMITDKDLSAIKYWLQCHHDDYKRNGYIPVIYTKK